MIDLQDHDVVSVENVGTRPFTAKYAGRRYRIEPGATQAVPWPAAKLWFGDPTLQDLAPDDMDVKFRTQEVERIGGKYGTLSAPFYTDEPAVTAELPEDHHKTPPRDYEPHGLQFRHPNLPRVVVRSMGATPQVVPMVIDDPWGKSPTPLQEAASAEEHGLKLAVAGLTQQLAELQAKLAVSSPESVAEIIAPEPNPSSVPTASDDAPVSTDGSEVDVLDPTVTDLFRADDDTDEDPKQRLERAKATAAAKRAAKR